MKHLIAALHAAAEATSKDITSDLHEHLRSSGWSETAIKSTKMTYENGEFTAKFSGKGKDAAFVHEFGDQNTPPTAAIRKYGKSTPKVTEAFLGHAAKSFKGLL